jgi:hypothetical protein
VHNPILSLSVLNGPTTIGTSKHLPSFDSATGSGHRPSRDEHQKSIQAQFDEHWKGVRSPE